MKNKLNFNIKILEEYDKSDLKTLLKYMDSLLKYFKYDNIDNDYLEYDNILNNINVSNLEPVIMIFLLRTSYMYKKELKNWC